MHPQHPETCAVAARRYTRWQQPNDINDSPWTAITWPDIVPGGAKGVEVRNGFPIGFIAGVAVCVIVASDQIGGVFTFIGALAEGIATILTAADGAGVLGVLAVIGGGVLIGRNWTENRRARKQGEDAWAKRKDFR